MSSSSHTRSMPSAPRAVLPGGHTAVWARATLRQPSVLAALAVLLALVAVWVVTFVVAAQPRTLDQRTDEVASQLRCPACNGETVAEASTPIAQQMRVVVRQKLATGESEQQVLADFRASYGDSILVAPPVSGFTLFIWLGPLVMLLLGCGIVALAAREWRAGAAGPGVALARGGSVRRSPPAGEAAEEDALEAQLAPEERARLLAALRREVAREEGLPLGETLEGEAH